MLWGSTLNTSKFNQTIIPTLQLGGELDGLTPIMRMVFITQIFIHYYIKFSKELYF